MMSDALSQPAKRRYMSPKLVHYGALRDLTQSGTKEKVEQGNKSKDGSLICATSGQNAIRFPCV